MSADTKQGNMQGMDPYSYVGNDPETRNDPSGQRFCNPTATRCGDPCADNCSPGSGNGGGGNPPSGPSGCTWNGKPCTKTNNPCIGTVWNGKGCVPGAQSKVDKDRQALDKHYANEKNLTSLSLEGLAVLLGIAEIFSLKGLIYRGIAMVLQAVVALGQAIHFVADIMLLLNNGVVTSTISNLLAAGDEISGFANALNIAWVGLAWLASIGGAEIEVALAPEIAAMVFAGVLVQVVAQEFVLGMQSRFDILTAEQSAVDNSNDLGFIRAQCISELGAANC